MSIVALPTPGTRAAPRPARVLAGFLLVEFACQLALLIPGFNHGPLRALWRTGIFALSIALVFLLRGRTRSIPPAVAAIWVMALMILEVFNPGRNTWLSALAQVGMYLAVLGPLFWMPRLEIPFRVFRRILLIFWGYYTLSTFAGLLQVYFPGRFQPVLSPVVQKLGANVAGLKIVLANGATMFRPMGLTDTPGGAATAGMWAVLFGLGFLLTARQERQPRWKQAMFAASMIAGMMCIYLSQLRVLVVVLAVCFVSLLAVLAWRARWRQFWLLAALMTIIAGGGYALSAKVGGHAVSKRVASIASVAHAAQTFSATRGLFVQQTVHQWIPDYPLGAGLGRWGMMNAYFGHPRGDRNGFLYVEIQWQGWVLDGGVPMLIAYLLLLGLTMLCLGRIARRRGPLALWAALAIAYDIAVLAMCFDYTPFTGEMGIEFWFVNALLLTTAACLERNAVLARARQRAWLAWARWRIRAAGAAPVRG